MPSLYIIYLSIIIRTGNFQLSMSFQRTDEINASHRLIVQWSHFYVHIIYYINSNFHHSVFTLSQWFFSQFIFTPAAIFTISQTALHTDAICIEKFKNKLMSYQKYKVWLNLRSSLFLSLISFDSRVKSCFRFPFCWHEHVLCTCICARDWGLLRNYNFSMQKNQIKQQSRRAFVRIFTLFYFHRKSSGIKQTNKVYITQIDTM